MITQRNNKDEVVIKIFRKIPPERLQAMADFIEYIEIGGQSMANEEGVNKPLGQVRESRWKRNKDKLTVCR